jgi:hypothetical protein
VPGTGGIPGTGPDIQFISNLDQFIKQKNEICIEKCKIKSHKNLSIHFEVRAEALKRWIVVDRVVA